MPDEQWIRVLGPKQGGHNLGKVGYIVGQQPNRSSANPASLVRFPGEFFPNDFRAISHRNMRPASVSEISSAHIRAK